MADDFVNTTSNKYLKRAEKSKIDDIEKVILHIRNVVDLQYNEGISILKEEDADRFRKIPIADLCNEFRRTEDQVTKYVREKCIKPNIDKAKQLYRPIFELQKKGASIKVFTTNYATAIENLCTELDIPFTDGFKRDKKSEYPIFDPTDFDRGIKNNEIIVYKLHGSVNWWWNEERKVIQD